MSIRQMPRVVTLTLVSLSLLGGGAAVAQQRDAHIGYVYPPSIQRGTTTEMTVGGQFLDGTSDAILSGSGLTVEVVAHEKPPTQREINDAREKMQEIQKRIRQSRRRGNLASVGTFASVAAELGVDPTKLQRLLDYRRKQLDPKRQLNPQLSETVTLKVTCHDDATSGRQHLRLLTSAGLSNPLMVYVDSLPELEENEPNESWDQGTSIPKLPAAVSGQIMPGDVDHFRFEASAGDEIVIDVMARTLMPYLADAVPGWFQATITLLDDQGREVAYADDFLVRPDPVLCYPIERSGTYTLQIRDAIYRGREDFVYRITLGELPLVTSVFPLGSDPVEKNDIRLVGWNLDTATGGVATRYLADMAVEPTRASLPDVLEHEPNETVIDPQAIEAPCVLHGRIGHPGDIDIFRFRGKAERHVVLEVTARRLGSPLDSVLTLSSAIGDPVVTNDDFEDQGAGLTTHHADSRIAYALPDDGVYHVTLRDAQGAGGEHYAYRLRVSEPRPDFALRVAPASINVRPGATHPITVFVLRRDGFDGEIVLVAENAPEGFSLSGNRIPPGQDHIRMTLSAPPNPELAGHPFELPLVGRAVIGKETIEHAAVPCEDMMQAFFYRHLVPVDRLMVNLVGPNRGRRMPNLVDAKPVAIPVGGTGRAIFAVPAAALENNIALELNTPPDGVSLEGIAAVSRGTALVFRADAKLAQAGAAGNLIVDAFIERSTDPKNPKAPNRRFPVGTLPAIPFEIVDR